MNTLAVADVRALRIDFDSGITLNHVVGVHPVRRGPFAVEQARLGQHEGARAERGDARAAHVSTAQLAHHGQDVLGISVVRTARDEDRVGPLHRVDTVGSGNGETEIGAQSVRRQRRSGRRAHLEVVGRHAVGRAVDTEDLAGNRHLENADWFEADDGDTVVPAHGRNLADIGSSANGRNMTIIAKCTYVDRQSLLKSYAPGHALHVTADRAVARLHQISPRRQPRAVTSVV